MGDCIELSEGRKTPQTIYLMTCQKGGNYRNRKKIGDCQDLGVKSKLIDKEAWQKFSSWQTCYILISVIVTWLNAFPKTVHQKGCILLWINDNAIKKSNNISEGIQFHVSSQKVNKINIFKVSFCNSCVQNNLVS